jgi:deoxyribonuclease V
VSREPVTARTLHPWRVSSRQAGEIQESLRNQLRLEPLPFPRRLVAAADVAYSQYTHRMYAAVVVVAWPSCDIVDTVSVVRRAMFPYVPGLLSFREVPPLLAAFARLRCVPDVVVFDGQGLAHPRGFGLACHAGLLLDIPSVGCAKSRLIGTHDEVGAQKGSATALRVKGETVGAVVRTRTRVKPVFVSPGHRADVRSAVNLVIALATRFRLPDPQRFAHQATVRRYQRDRDRGRPAETDRRYRNFIPRR